MGHVLSEKPFGAKPTVILIVRLVCALQYHYQSKTGLYISSTGVTQQRVLKLLRVDCRVEVKSISSQPQHSVTFKLKPHRS